MIIFLLLIAASIWNSHIVGAAAPVARAAAGIAPAARAAAIGRLVPEQLAGIRAVPTAQLTKPVTYSAWPTALQFNPGVGLSWEPTVRSIYEHGTGHVQRLLNDPKVGMFNLVQNTFRTTQLPSNPFYSFSGEFAGKVAHAIRTGEIFNTKTVEELIQAWRKHHLAITGEKITEQRARDAMNNILRAVEDEQFAGKLPEGTVANIITANQVMRDDAQQKLRDFYKQLGLDVTMDPTKKYTDEELNQPLTTSLLYKDPTLYQAAYIRQKKGPESIPPRTYQTQNSYQGSASRPDCVEAMLREFIYHILYDPQTQSFDLKRLPPTITPDPKLIEFFQKHSRATQAAANAASADFYALVADRKGVTYTNGNNEVQSDPANELKLLRQLFGLSEKEAPTWEALGEKLSTKELSVSIKESQKDPAQTIYTFTITDDANKRRYTMGLDIRKGHSEICMRPHFTAVSIPDIQQYSRLPEETGTALYPVVGVDTGRIKHPAQLGLLAQTTHPRNVQTLNQGLAEALRQGDIDTALTFLNKYHKDDIGENSSRHRIMGILKTGPARNATPAIGNALKTLADLDRTITYLDKVYDSAMALGAAPLQDLQHYRQQVIDNLPQLGSSPDAYALNAAKTMQRAATAEDSIRARIDQLVKKGTVNLEVIRNAINEIPSPQTPYIQKLQGEFNTYAALTSEIENLVSAASAVDMELSDDMPDFINQNNQLMSEILKSPSQDHGNELNALRTRKNKFEESLANTIAHQIAQKQDIRSLLRYISNITGSQNLLEQDFENPTLHRTINIIADQAIGLEKTLAMLQENPLDMSLPATQDPHAFLRNAMLQQTKDALVAATSEDGYQAFVKQHKSERKKLFDEFNKRFSDVKKRASAV